MSNRKQVHPGVAIAMLLGSGGFLWWSFAGDSDPFESSQGAGAEIVDPAAEENAINGDAVEWRDLLAAFGSYDIKIPVRLSFASVPESAAGTLPAAPFGEHSGSTMSRWAGLDPPLLRLGVVLVGGDVRRAFLGGQLVGIGDEINGARIVSIVKGAVTARWNERVLTYDLESSAPVEFRAEYARRQREAAGREEGLGLDPIEEGAVAEPGEEK